MLCHDPIVKNNRSNIVLYILSFKYIKLVGLGRLQNCILLVETDEINGPHFIFSELFK